MLIWIVRWICTHDIGRGIVADSKPLAVGHFDDWRAYDSHPNISLLAISVFTVHWLQCVKRFMGDVEKERRGETRSSSGWAGAEMSFFGLGRAGGRERPSLTESTGRRWTVVFAMNTSESSQAFCLHRKHILKNCVIIPLPFFIKACLLVWSRTVYRAT